MINLGDSPELCRNIAVGLAKARLLYVPILAHGRQGR